MKKLIILLWLICAFGSTFAQKKDLLKDLITNIQSKNITIVGCLVNEEFIGSKLPFVKKMAVESGDLVAFIMSDPYIDEATIICRDVLIFNRKTHRFEEHILKENHKILDDFLRKQKNKEFSFICGITD